MVRVVGKEESAVKRITCRSCASILEYTRNEINRYIGRDYSGGPDGKEWIICPSCGSDITIRSW